MISDFQTGTIIHFSHTLCPHNSQKIWGVPRKFVILERPYLRIISMGLVWLLNRLILNLAVLHSTWVLVAVLAVPL